MPRVFFIFLFITTSLLAEMNWAEDYKSGLKEAAQKQKKVIVYFSEEDCAKCDAMSWTISFDKNVSNYITEHFVAIEIDIEYDKRQGFKIYQTPTIYFLDTKAKQIGKPLTNVLGPKGFLKKLKEIQNSKQ